MAVGTLATAVAVIGLVAGTTVAVVPQLRIFLDRTDLRVTNEQARAFVRAADEVQERDPDEAMRMRIAAAAVDPDGGSMADLAAFLRLRFAEQPYTWIRTNRLVAAGPWAVALDNRGVVTAWDLRSTRPMPVALDRDVQDIEAIGYGGWLQLVDGQGNARLVDLDVPQPRPFVSIGPEPDRVAALGQTGWIVVWQGRTVSAWDLSVVNPSGPRYPRTLTMWHWCPRPDGSSWFRTRSRLRCPAA
jgi:hypothetical protein